MTFVSPSESRQWPKQLLQGNYGKVNLLQPPPQASDVTDASNGQSDQSDMPKDGAQQVTVRYYEQTAKIITVESELSLSAAATSAARNPFEHASLQRPTIPANMPLTGEEAQIGLEILDGPTFQQLKLYILISSKFTTSSDHLCQWYS